MTLLQIYNRIAREMGETEGSVSSQYLDWINEAQRQVWQSHNFVWRYKKGVIQTVAEYSTGTITTDGTSAIVGLGTTFTSAMVGRRLEIDGDGQRYLISAFTDATNITIDRNVERSNASALTYTIRKLDYSFPSDCEEILSMRHEKTPIKIYSADVSYFDSVAPKDTDTGNPYFFIPTGRDSSGYLIGRFYPLPIAVLSIDYIYFKSIPDLADNADTSVIPAQYHDLLVFYALHKAQQFYGDMDLAGAAYNQFQDKLGKLITADKNNSANWLFFKQATADELMRVPHLPDDNYYEFPFIGD